MSQKKKLLLAAVSSPGRINFAPPLGLLYLAAYLRDRFPLEISILDQYIEEVDSEQLVKRIVAFAPDVVGLSYTTMGAHLVPNITQSLREALPQALIVLGGAHITAVREEALVNTCADIGVHGEGELSFEKVLQAHFDGQSMDQIAGLIWRNSDGDIMVNPGAMPLVQDIDTLPMPAYDLIDLKRYWSRSSMVQVPERKYISLISSRGCPYDCIYCHKPFGREYRTHSPERMVEEIRRFKKEYQFDEVEFRDDCFNVKVKRVLAYSDLLIKTIGPVKTAYVTGLRLDLLNDEIIDALKDAGMYFAGVPLESGTPRIQKILGKQIEIPRFMSIVESLVKRRVFTSGHVIFGFPSETLEEMEESFCVAMNSRLHAGAFFVVLPFPNTPLYKHVMENMPERMKNFSYSTTDLFDFRHNLSDVPTKQFAEFFRRLPLRFYTKPSRMARIFRDYPKRRHLIFGGYSLAKDVLAKTMPTKAQE